MKRKIFAIITCLLVWVAAVYADPAYKGKINYTQPDGSTITIQLHGDEFFSWATDQSGRILEQGTDGFYRVSSLTQADVMASMAAANSQREAQWGSPSLGQSSLKQNEISVNPLGTPKIVVILVGFSDKAFTNPKENVEAMLNQEGYSENGASGSVKDWYRDNSHSKFIPTFDVYGPVTLDKTLAYYGAKTSSRNDVRPYEMVRDACNKLKSQIPWGDYDNDGDGVVDNVLIYFAGYSQASSGRGDDIWSHRSTLSGYYSASGRTFGGYKVDSYTCASEYRGSSGTSYAIGTTCHELGHALGLPDFYDSDSETNGKTHGMGKYSPMSSGNQLNSYRTPCLFTSEELRMLGWADCQENLTSAGQVTLGALAQWTAYKTAASNDKEYFVYESRGDEGWDEYLGKGLLVYHVDRRTTKQPDLLIGGSSYSPNYLWTYYPQYANRSGAHPCCYVVPSGDQSNTNYSGSKIVFSEETDITSYTPIDWDGNEIGVSFTNISYAGGVVTMNVEFAKTHIKGLVVDTYGYPIPNAAVEATLGTKKLSTTADATGYYSILVEDAGTWTVTASAAGFVSAGQSVEISVLSVEQDIVLMREGEQPESDWLYTYDPTQANTNLSGSGNGCWTAADIFPAEFTASQAGRKVSQVSIYLNKTESLIDGLETEGEVYLIIDIGTTRTLVQKIEEPVFGEWNTIDVSNRSILVPQGQNLYIGFAIKDCKYSYPLVYKKKTDDSPYASRVRAYEFDTETLFSSMGAYTGSTPIRFKVADNYTPDPGYNYISNPGEGTYAAGTKFDLILVQSPSDTPSSVSWKYDGAATGASSVTLTAGTHTVEALLVFPDGSEETMRLILTVK